MALSIIYRDLAPGALEKTTASSSATLLQAFAATAADLLNDNPTPKVATLEQDYWRLGEDFALFPDSPSDESKWGLWSKALSDGEGKLSSPITIDLKLSEQVSCVGITLTFDVSGNAWCNDLVITWYRAGQMIARHQYKPTSAEYTCVEKATNFDRVVITCRGTSQPYRYLKVASVKYGVIREFGPDDYYSVSVSQKISPISETIEINTLEASVRNVDGIPYMWQSQQQISVMDGAKCIGEYYLDTATRTGTDTYRITCEDALSLLPTNHDGGIYDGEALDTVLASITGGAIECEIDEALAGQKVYGYLPRDTALNNLARVAFAAGAIVDTSGSDLVRVFPEPAKSAKWHIYGQNNTYEGGSVSTSKMATSLIVTAHNYALSPDVQTLYEDYIQGNDIATIYMSEPCGGYTVKQPFILYAGTGANVVRVHNYSLNQQKATLTGRKYIDSTTTISRTNPDANEAATTNELTVSNVSTITPKNVEAIADRLLQHYRRRDTITTKVVYDGVRPGDRAQIVDVFGVMRRGTVTAVDIIGGNSTTAANITVLCDKEG